MFCYKNIIDFNWKNSIIKQKIKFGGAKCYYRISLIIFVSFDENAEFELLAPSNKVKNRFPDNYVVTDAGYDVLKVAVVIGENAGGKN